MRRIHLAVAMVLGMALPAAASAQGVDAVEAFEIQRQSGNAAAQPYVVERQTGRGLEPADARRVWAELQMLLNTHPPSLRIVLQADPSLLNRPDYLAPYPRIAEFLKQHPEVARDPTFFLGTPDARFDRDETPAERASRRAYDTLEGMLAGLAVLTGAMAVLFILATLVRQALAHRRWLRQSRVQTEVHTKILDRLQSNDELLAYIQTPAGQRFLQSGPSPQAEAEPRTMAAPFGRIFWSAQVGVILVALGIGFWFVQRTAMPEIAPAFTAMGVIATALGIGAVCSGVVSYLLSARFGLLERSRD